MTELTDNDDGAFFFEKEEPAESAPLLLAHKNRTAILLLDFQNEFVKKGGKLHDDVAATMEITGLLRNAPKLVEFARKSEALVIYSPVVMKETGVFESAEDSDFWDSRDQKVKYSKQFGLFTENTWNCEICHEVEPKTDDVILHDRSDFSAFAGTKLQSILKTNKIDHFFITGFLTDICVYQTSKDAAKLMPNMSTYVVKDACAAKRMDDHETALDSIEKKSVKVVSCSEAESLLAKCAEHTKRQILDGRDKWMMVDKIFSVAGVKENETIAFDQLKSLIGSMPSSASILSILFDNLDARDKGNLTRESMHRVLFDRKERSGFVEKLPVFIIVWLIPIFYSMSTRLPFIFLSLEILDAREGTFALVSAVLGVYQTSRALGNLLIVVFGGNDPFKRLEIIQICCGLFGWLFVALYQRDAEQSFFSSELNNASDGGGNIWPFYLLFFVGLGESVVNLQRAIMIETAKETPSGVTDEAIVASRFSKQYAMVALGSIIAFVGGGQVYAKYGYAAVCELGILCQIVQLIAAITYLALVKNSKRNIKGDDLDGNDLIRSVIYQFQAASVIAKCSKDVARGTGNALKSEMGGMSAAAIKAKQDRILNHSLREMYQCFFTKERDDVASMVELLKSIDKTETGLASKRPQAMAVGKAKLSKLLLFLMKTKGEGPLSEREFISYWAPRVYLSMFESSQEASVNVVWPYMKAVCLTQALAALCIGTFLSTALLSYTRRFGIDSGRVGLLLGIGEGLGMIAILMNSIVSSRGSSSKKNDSLGSGSNIMRIIFARPLHVPFVIFVASISSIFFSIDNLWIAVVFQMIFSSVNDLSVSLMNELTGTSLPAEKFRLYQGLGQWLRRVGNMVTAILGPIFFGIDPSLPFVFFGVFVFVWALILWFLMFKHADRMKKSTALYGAIDDKGDSKKEKKSWFLNSAFGTPFAPFVETVGTPWHVLEQRYYSVNKERIEEELNPWKKASVDISLLETRVRCIAAALEVEKDQRRALEDRMYARVSTTSESPTGVV